MISSSIIVPLLLDDLAVLIVESVSFFFVSSSSPLGLGLPAALRSVLARIFDKPKYSPPMTNPPKLIALLNSSMPCARNRAEAMANG